MERPVKLTPSENELIEIKTNLRCIVEGCVKVFKNSRALDVHVLKHHKILCTEPKSKTIYHYFCPSENCQYNIDRSDKGFRKKNDLKQHFLKVHAPKVHSCEGCGRRFSCLRFLRNHRLNCGKLFYCSCGWKYESKEALKTHIKRQWAKSDGNHEMRLEPLVSECSKPEAAIIFIDSSHKPTLIPKLIPILPKQAPSQNHSTHLLAAKALVELAASYNPHKAEVGTQTDGLETNAKRQYKRSNSLVNYRSPKKKKSAETQTKCVNKGFRKQKCSAETQTFSHIKRQKYDSSNNEPNNGPRKSMETQTNNIELFSGDHKLQSLQNCAIDNLSLEMDHFASDILFNSKISFGVQTGAESDVDFLMTSPVDSQNCDIDSLWSYDDLSNYVPNPDLNSIETQTDINCEDLFSSELNCSIPSVESSSQTHCTETSYLDDLLYINMYTQTPNRQKNFLDIFSFSNN